MVRLLPEVLYKPEDARIHYARACKRGDNPEPWNLGDAEILAKRIKEIDPDGRRSYAALLEVMHPGFHEFYAFKDAGYSVFENDDGEWYIGNRFGGEWTENKLVDILDGLDPKTMHLTNIQVEALKALRFWHLADYFGGYGVANMDDLSIDAFFGNSSLKQMYDELKDLLSP